jgi:S1-C subfamily serine protease
VPAPLPMAVVPAAPASPSAPANMVTTPPEADNKLPGSTAEIQAPNPEDLIPQQAPQDADPEAQSNEVARYQEEQSGMPPEQLKALQEFDSEGELSTPFGMQLREAKRTLKSGEDADGLLITSVEKGSPAAAAGLQPYSHAVHDALTAAAMVGAVFSGGLAVVVIPALDYMQVGESYDLIIGVDGSRVTNFLDFQDRMRDLQPGELVYLSVVRNGKRLQITLSVPSNIQQATN